ncbi:endochitinase 33 [Podospora australis]|uniref:chitinase n=1 Tax=Podospora australis TaxID=1536484 RepID=A0AAN7AJF3_9PEZI|nr:endochitinase 33 [Podospora australis]
MVLVLPRGFVGLYSLLVLVGVASAGFDPAKSNNIAVYWVNIIPLAFLHVIKNPTSVNFANAGDNCTTFPGTQLLRCPQIEEDIKTCQTLGKTLLLSIGGATYTEGGFTSPAEAISFANLIWNMFGPVRDTSINRPFGTAVIDGFDMDLEATSANMVPFAAELRRLMDAGGGNKKYYLSAAPQCPFPDHAMGDMLSQVGFDFVSVQFYNNYCGAQNFVPGAGEQFNYNFETWDEWARTKSVKRDVKVLLGLPGAATAAGSGYVAGEKLRGLIEYSRRFGTFGGVMVWDMSQVYGNPGFLETVSVALGGTIPPPLSTSTTSRSTAASTRTSTTLSTSTTSSTQPTGSLVPQWGQCGGNGYGGSTQCAPPYRCVFLFTATAATRMRRS